MASQFQPTRDILPVTLREGEEQAQLEELGDGDDDWFRPTSRGRETLGQRLTRTVTEGTSINIAVDTEFTSLVESETFPVDIAPFAGDKEEGAMEAKKHTDGVSELSFWTEWSRLNSGQTGASVALCDLSGRQGRPT